MISMTLNLLRCFMAQNVALVNIPCGFEKNVRSAVEVFYNVDQILFGGTVRVSYIFMIFCLLALLVTDRRVSKPL